MNKHDKFYLYGAGGHANVVAEVLKATGVKVVAVFDDDTTKTQSHTSGIRIRGESFPVLNYPVVITIGDNAVRAELSRLLDAEFGTAIHPTAIISPSSTIGKGTVVLHGAIVQANTNIGQHALINTGASVDHDNVIGDFVHVSPQAALCGHVEIGEGTHIGAAATVIPSVKIGKWCTIGAGSVVINNIPDYCTAVGNPARIIKQNCPSPNQSETEQSFDLTIIGSGLASTMTLVNLIQKLEDSPPTNPVKIALIEPNDFFAGLAYGDRAGKKSLVITSLEEFLPETERAHFKNWLDQNKDSLFAAPSDSTNDVHLKWVQDNKDSIAVGDWDSLFLPRYVFGIYLKQKANEKLREGVKAGLIKFESIAGSATDVERKQDGFAISVNPSNGQSSGIRSSRVVLAVGSPPFRKLFDEKAYSRNLGALLINDPYQVSMGDTIDRITSHFERRRITGGNILIIGSNASTIETIFNCNASPRILDRLGKIFVLSISGEFPVRLKTNASKTPFETTHLNQLQRPTAKDVFEAAREDILSARRTKMSFCDLFDPISSKVNQLISQLSTPEKQAFVNYYGVELGRYQRRAGDEYVDVIDELKARNQIEFLTGCFDQVGAHDQHGMHFDYVDANGNRKRFSAPIHAAISCTGFERIESDSTSPLIRNLLRRKIAVATPSRFGLVVDKNLSLQKNLYVVGPLLAGNIIGETMVWHAEHCGRIIRFSKILASNLADEILADGFSAVSNSSPATSTEINPGV